MATDPKDDLEADAKVSEFLAKSKQSKSKRAKAEQLRVEKAVEVVEPTAKPAVEPVVETTIDVTSSNDDQSESKVDQHPKDRKGFWATIKASYRFIAVLIFLGAGALIVLTFSKPWLDSWLTNERPDIDLPSVTDLQTMPFNERMKWKNDAIRLAQFREKRLVSDPIPFEGGRPLELAQYKLRAVGKGVKTIGVLRLYEMPDTRQFLRLTDFEITAGYNLRVLISVHHDPKSKEDLDIYGYIDLAALKGENGPQNYLLPKTFELSDFESFVIYDDLFEIVYAVSPL